MSTELEDYLRMIGLSTDMLLKPSSAITADGGSTSPRRASPTPVAGPADDTTNTAIDDVMSPRENEASSHNAPQPARPSTDAGQRRQSSSVLGVPPPPPPKVFRPRRAAVDEDDEVSSVMTYIVTSTVADFDPESRRSPTPPPLPPPLRPESIHWNPEAEERSSPVALLDTSTPQPQQQIQSTHQRPSSVISIGTVSQKSMYGNLQNGRRIFQARVVDSNNIGSVAAVQSPPSTTQFNGDSTVTRVPSSSVLGGSRASAVNVTTSTVNCVAPLPPQSPRLPSSSSSSQEQTSSTNVRLPTDPSVMSTLTRRNNTVSSQFGTLTHTGPAKSASTSSIVVGNGTVTRRAPSQTDASSVIVSPAAAAAAAGTSSVPIPRVDAAEPAPHYTSCKIVLGAHDDDVQTIASKVDAYELAANQPGRIPPVVPAAAANTTQSYTSTIIRCSSSSATKVSTKTNQNPSTTMSAAAAPTVHHVSQMLPATHRVEDSAFQHHQNNSSPTGTAPIAATLAVTKPKSSNPLQSHVAAPNYVSVIRIGSTSSVGSAAEQVGTSPSWTRRSAAEPVVFKTVPVAAPQSPLVQSQPSTPLGSRECVSTRLHSDDVAPAGRSSPCDGSVVGSLQGPVKSSLKKSPKSAAVPAPRHVKTKSVTFSTGSVEDCNDLVTSSTEEVDGDGGGSWMQCGVRAIQANHNGGVDDFGRGRTLSPVLVNEKSIHQLPSNASPLGSRAAQSAEGLHHQQQQKQQQRTGSLWNGGMRTLPAGRTRVVVTAETFQTGQLLQSGASTQPFAAVGRDVDPAMSATLPPSRRAPPGHISNNVDDSRQTSSELDDRRFRSFPTAETSTSSDRSPVGFDVMTERLIVPRSAFSSAATSTAAATNAVVSRTGSGRAVAAVAPRTASTNHQNNNNNNNNNNSVDYRRRVLSIGENPGETTEDCITDVKHSNGGGEKSSPRRAPLEGNNNRTLVLSVDDRSSLALTRNEMTNQKTQIKKAARNSPRNANKQCKVQ